MRIPLLGVLACAPLCLYGPQPLRVPAGLLLCLVWPGMAVTALLFSGGKGPAGVVVSTLERMLLTGALSLASTVLGGLAIQVVTGRVTSGGWVWLAAGVTVAASLAGIISGRLARRGASPPEEAPDAVESAPDAVESASAAPAAGATPGGAWGRQLRWLVPVALAAVVLGASAVISVHSATARDDDQVTALWALPVGDRTPEATGASGARTVNLGVTSAEPADTRYIVELTGAATTQRFAFHLRHGETWQTTVEIDAFAAGVEARLFWDGDALARRTVYLNRPAAG